MKLSQLQKYILKQCFDSRDHKIFKAAIWRFYNKRKKKPKPKNIITIVTKSVERLIKKGLIIGYGRKTAQMWFIKEVRLTPQGRKITKSLFGQQQKLPLKIKKRKD